MIGCWILLAFFVAGDGSGRDFFRVSFHSGGFILAQQAPLQKSGRFVFRRHPDGVLLSVDKSEVAGIVVVSSEPSRSLRPGERVDVGLTGEGPERTGGPPQPGLLREERPPGSPPVNPIWEYRSLSGRRLIVGASIPFPPAPAVRRAPGEPPMGVQSGPPPTRPD